MSACTNPASLTVGGVALAVNEAQGPWIVSPSGLWQAKGYIRGAWTVPFAGDSPSGVCSLSASFNGQPLALGAGSAVARNSGTWHQCAGATANPTVQTADYGSGAMPLTIGGCDAAGACTGNAFTKTVYVDNSHPWVSLSPPRDVPATGAAESVTASAGGSRSGIMEIDCRVDGGANQRYLEHGAQRPSVPVAVTGIGTHSIWCTAANASRGQDGSLGWATTAAHTTLKIGQPAIAGISFVNVVNKLRCARVTRRVRIPGRRAHTKVVKVMRCHPRVVRRRVTVWKTVRRHGRKVRVKRKKLVRVVLPPRIVNSSTRRVRYGAGTTVNGWLGTPSGTPLAGQTVRVLTAPDNGQGQFSQAATAVTAANGGWAADLPAGPSRLVEATYDGTPSTEAAASGQARLVVPSKLAVKIKPARVRWGSKIVISGRILGGYIPSNPQAVSQLLRLRIGIRGIHISQTAGIPDVDRAGNFRTSYCFGTGRGVVHYWFSVSTLREVDYPFHPATSRRIPVRVGPRNAGRPCG